MIRSKPNQVFGEQGVAGIQAMPDVDAVLCILTLIGEAGQPLALNDIAERSGVPPDLAQRLIARLVSAGYVVALADGRMDIGTVAISLGTNGRQSHQPSNIVSSVLRRLVEECSQSATFYIADGDDRVCIDRVEAKTALRTYVRVGTRLPLALGAGGHVLMAFNGAVGEQYDHIRKAYLATSVGQLEADESSMAAPVFGPDDRLFGSILVSGPSKDFTQVFIHKLHGLMLKHAADLTVRLGGSAQRFPRADDRAG
jgi:DNA-binding IclR family transcriptional regulator